MKFNEILRNIRKSSGKSIRDVARETGISYDNLGRYERDENEPNIATLIILADYYKVSLDYLLRGDEDGFFIHKNEYLALKDKENKYDKIFGILNTCEREI